MVVRRLWALLLVVSLLVWLGAIAVGASAHWTISCGSGGSGLDCLPFNDHVSFTTTTAPARWLGAETLFAIGGIAFLALMASVIVWPATRPRSRRRRRFFRRGPEPEPHALQVARAAARR